MEFPSERQLSDSYELEGSIGKGGFGSVYAGTCKKTGIPVSCQFCFVLFLWFYFIFNVYFLGCII